MSTQFAQAEQDRPGYDRVVVHAFEVRHIPTADEVKLRRPAGCIAGYQAKGLAKGAPVLTEQPSSGRWTNARQKLNNPKACDSQPNYDIAECRPSYHRKRKLE
jgi:hypothetical protein